MPWNPSPAGLAALWLGQQLSHTIGEAHDLPLPSSPSGGLGMGTGGSELATHTLWHFKEGYGSHRPCPGMAASWSSQEAI